MKNQIPYFNYLIGGCLILIAIGFYLVSTKCEVHCPKANASKNISPPNKKSSTRLQSLDEPIKGLPIVD